MEEQTFSIGELSTQELILPVDLQVIKGCDEVEGLRSLSTGGVIRLHFFRNETVITGQAERGNQKLTIPLNCEELFELLPSRPELDDLQFKTAGHIATARLMPKRVRATQDWQGDTGENAIQENDELEDIRTIDDDVLGRCLTANRVVEGEGGNSKKTVCIPYQTAVLFTTRANPHKRYRLVDLVQQQHRSLPQRVRVHSQRVIHTGLPPVPAKARLMKMETQRIAVCSDRQNGRVFTLPATLEDVLVRVQGWPQTERSEGRSRFLHPWIDVTFLPRVGPEPLDELFGAQSMQESRTNDLAVLIPRHLTDKDGENSDYRTYEAIRHQTDRSEMKGVQCVDDDVNFLSRHCTLHATVAAVQCLIGNSTQNKDTDSTMQTSLNDYENPQDLNGYEQVTPGNPDPQQLYVPMYSAGHCPDDEYSYALSQEAFPRSFNLGPPSHPPPELPTLPQLEQLNLNENVTKLDKLRKENDKLRREICHIVDQMAVMGSQMDPEVDRHVDIVEIDQDVMRQHLESLSTAQIIKLLKNVGMGQYEKQFVELGVQGYELGNCDRKYLQDVGMSLTHSSKLLTILRGRLPPGTEWKGLIQ